MFPLGDKIVVDMLALLNYFAPMLDIILVIGLLAVVGLSCLIPFLLAVTFFMAGESVSRHLTRKQ